MLAYDSAYELCSTQDRGQADNWEAVRPHLCPQPGPSARRRQVCCWQGRLHLSPVALWPGASVQSVYMAAC